MKTARDIFTLALLLGVCATTVTGCGRQLGGQAGQDGGSGTGDDGSAPFGDGGRTFTTQLQTGVINKVDLLFDIDNSSSMGDKQFYLEQAVPDLVFRLTNPNCLSDSGSILGPSNGGRCASGSPEFPAVHDMHVGILSSSLGARGVTGPGSVCDPASSSWNTTGPFKDGTAALNSHVDDQGHLLARAAPFGVSPQEGEEEETTMPESGAQSFLDWFPNVPANAGASPNPAGFAPALVPLATRLISVGSLEQTGTLEGDFGQLVAGVHFYGCGIESQLESWYRFLIQPDPYASIAINSGGTAQWSGVDSTIIRQRHDFLRPDSLVAIVVLTDENDSEIDVRSVAGSGYLFMSTAFDPPRGTSACETNPQASNCFSCLTQNSTTASDPNCKKGTYSSENDWGYYINVRHSHMAQKYGFDVQFPLQRYVLGLTSPKVPDRDHEYPSGASAYQGGTSGDPADLNCTNPLFAATLPDGSDPDPTTLCNASGARGPRTPGLVFYAHIGGVPHQLLQASPGETDSQGNVLCPASTPASDCPQKDTLSVADWTKILGNGPATDGSPYDYTGIDPHMVESYTTNRGLPSVNPTGYPQGGGPDPISGGDWATDVNSPHPQDLPVDLEYACIFPLPAPRDCSDTGGNPVTSYSCSCGASGLAGTQVSPVCGIQNPAEPPSLSNDYTTQYYAKAYPTIRELTLAKLLGSQGIVSSLCPIHVTDQNGGNDPVYGYRPAVTSIVNRLRDGLGGQCLPQALPTQNTSSGAEVSCLLLVTLQNSMSAEEDSACSGIQGLSVPDASVLSEFQAKQHAQWLTTMAGVDPSTLATCEMQQLTVPSGGTCVGTGAVTGADPGWCYVTGSAAGVCGTQAILFTPGLPPDGSTATLECTLLGG